MSNKYSTFIFWLDQTFQSFLKETFTLNSSLETCKNCPIDSLKTHPVEEDYSFTGLETSCKSDGPGTTGDLRLCGTVVTLVVFEGMRWGFRSISCSRLDRLSFCLLVNGGLLSCFTRVLFPTIRYKENPLGSRLILRTVSSSP